MMMFLDIFFRPTFAYYLRIYQFLISTTMENYYHEALLYLDRQVFFQRKIKYVDISISHAVFALLHLCLVFPLLSFVSYKPLAIISFCYHFFSF